MNSTIVSRCGWTAASALLIVWAFLLFGYSDSYPMVSACEVVLGLLGIGSILLTWTVEDARLRRWVELIILGGTIVGFGVWCWVQIRVAPSYGTDEVAFDQYAAQLLLHGHNPYMASMAPAFNIFHVSPNGFTFRLDGTAVTQLSYPSMSFLVYVPFLWLGLNIQAGIIVNCLAWAIALVVGYALLPRDLRWIVLVLGFMGLYVGFAVGGVTDAIYVPLLMVGIAKWDKYHLLEGWRRWIAPTALGLALGVKQTPWLVLPFVLTAMALESEAAGVRGMELLRRPWGYLWRTVVIFIAPNVPFMIWNFHGWLHGVLTPIEGGIVPAGEGYIALSNFLGLGGGNLTLYGLLGLGILGVLVAALIATYPKAKPLIIFFPSIALFFVARSFANYLTMLLLPLLVGAASVDLSHLKLPRRSTKALALLLIPPVVFSATMFVATAAIGQPLSIQIQSVQTTGQLATVIRVTVEVRNESSSTQVPVFSTESGGAITAPWNILTGPATLQKGETAVYELGAPNFFAQPQLTSGFQVVGLTKESMSVSAPFLATNWHLELTPEAVNLPVVIGVPVTVTATVVDATNQPVRRAGIGVYLGQVTYAQGGLVYSQAIINASNPGETPVEALTNQDGVATFTISGTQAAVDPVYFEANLVNSSSDYPYGYSTILPIQFVN